MYNHTISGFLRTGNVPSPPKTTSSCDQKETLAVKLPRVDVSGPNSRCRLARDEHETERVLAFPCDNTNTGERRRRRGGIIPGTRAGQSPLDPPEEKPFSISVDTSGTISVELVVHVHGSQKVSFALGLKHQGDAGESRGDNGEIEVAVTPGAELDGVHGAPVFLGGTLFAFALQVRGEERMWIHGCRPLREGRGGVSSMSNGVATSLLPRLLLVLAISVLP